MRQRAVKLNSLPSSLITCTVTSCRGFSSPMPVIVYFSLPSSP